MNEIFRKRYSGYILTVSHAINLSVIPVFFIVLFLSDVFPKLRLFFSPDEKINEIHVRGNPRETWVSEITGLESRRVP